MECLVSLVEAVSIIRHDFFLIDPGYDGPISIDDDDKIDDTMYAYIRQRDTINAFESYGIGDDLFYIQAAYKVRNSFIDAEHLICVFSKLPNLTVMSKEVKDRHRLIMGELRRPVTQCIITQVITINNEYKKQIEELTQMNKELLNKMASLDSL